MKSTEVPPSKCRRCGLQLDQASGKGSPKAGDFSVCAYCATISIFDTALTFREPTIAEMRLLLGNKFASAAIDLIWQRSVVDDGNEMVFPCGCIVSSGELFTIRGCAESCVAVQFTMMQAERVGKPVIVIR